MEMSLLKKHNNSVNIIWTIIILSIIIVLLLAFILLDKVLCAERIVKYLSYTSTLLSILLSVFAILFSYYSSNKLDLQISAINVAVEEIKATNNLLNQSNQTLVQTLISMHEKLGHIEANQAEEKNSQTPTAPTNNPDDSNKPSL